MVDINLFDDEPEEGQQGHEDQSFDNLDDGGELSLNDDLGGDIGNAFDDDINEDSGRRLEEENKAGGFRDGLDGGESIDDALGFDDDFANSDELSDEGMLDDDLSGLDDDTGSVDGEDYEFGGGGGGKKSMKLIWTVLILVGLIVVIVIYKDMIMALLPGRNKPVIKPARMTQTANVPAAGKGAVSSAAVSDSSMTPAGRPGQPISKKLTGISIQLLNDLSSKGQFNMMIVDHDRFAVEYASTGSGAAGVFAERIKALTKATAVVASPEDAHSANGKTYYFGVISGKFDPATVAPTGGGAGFQSDDTFINTVKGKILQQGLSLASQKKRSSQGSGSQSKSSFEFVLEGEKEKAIAFLQSLNTIEGAWEPDKIRISPADLNDFSAARVKIVLDATAIVGKTPSVPTVAN